MFCPFKVFSIYLSNILRSPSTFQFTLLFIVSSSEMHFAKVETARAFAASEVELLTGVQLCHQWNSEQVIKTL